jgi:diguanylate cyclase (GGDEF)-like protein
MRQGPWMWGAVAAALLVAGATLSAVAAGAVARRAADSHQRRFETSAAEISSTLSLDVQRSADLAVALTAWLAEHPTASNQELAGWIQRLRAFERFPEFVSAGLMVPVSPEGLPAYIADVEADVATRPPGLQTFELTPPGDRPFFCFLRLSVPRDPALFMPLGLDVCSLGTADRLLATRDTGTVSYEAVTFPSGTFLGIQTPVYAGGSVPPTVEARQAAFRGWLGTVVDPASILSRARAAHPDLAVRLRYDSERSDVTFSSGRAPRDGASRMLDVDEGWQATITGPAISRGITSDDAATLLLVAGLLLTATFVVLVVVLATGRRRAQYLVRVRTEELHQLALHDPLTGLANRALVADRLENLVTRARRSGTTPAVLYLDLDGFKAINDGFGHEAGDRLLQAVALRLGGELREVDTIGRLGGDEFVVLLECATPDDASAVAGRLNAVLRMPYELGAEPMVVSASIGVATGDRETANDLLRDADAGLYRAKARGRDRFETLSPLA